MTKNIDPLRETQIQEFVTELTGFATSAEKTLGVIESDPEGSLERFDAFARMMLTIRGTSQHLGFGRVADIARLGEEIAVKATGAESRSQVRKCVGSLWDVITTVKHLIVNRQQETSEEEKILVNRLEHTLKAFGGARPTVGDDEIEKLLKENG